MARARKQGRGGAGRRSGIQKPVQPDDVLAAVVGDEPLPRTELTRRMWDYIKSHDLQDPDDRRVVRSDATLKRVFGQKSRVTMFEIARYMNEHVS